MILHHILLLLMMCFVAQTLANYCDSISPPVPTCPDNAARDLLFLVDGSNSMNRDRFYREMLDYCLSLYCAFDPKMMNQAGLIVFNEQVKVYVPLAPYSPDEWFDQVEAVRATKDSNTPACCTCCTPTAEAFDEASAELEARGRNGLRMAFTITDGVPSNNFADTGGNPDWWYYNPTLGFNPAVYNMRIVPERANALKEKGIRLFLVGVPDRDGNPPDQKYFSGQLAVGSGQCTRRSNTKFCAKYYKPPFPIVSEPVNKNSFSTKTWNVQQLITQTVGAMCEIFPTTTPTKPPTGKPTTSPTPKPTQAPTQSPSGTPSKSPTRRPTGKPAQSPTRRPSKSPTDSPTRRPSKSPSRSPSKSPTKTPSKSPTKSPSRSPTKRPTSYPTNSPTKSPSRTPSASPTRTPSQSPTKFPTWAPTKSPTTKPTKSPTNTPSHSPTSKPTSKTPTRSPTRSPTHFPTSQAPTSSPTRTPTLRPTSRAPTRSPTRSPTLFPTSQAPTVSPTSLPTKSPSKAPTRKPTLRPTSMAPSKSPTRTPSLSPTNAPVIVHMEQVDLTFIVDRSKSMRWHDKVCQRIVDGAPVFGNKKSTSQCWELFMRYILAQVDAITEVRAGAFQERPLGWAEDFPGQLSPAKGLRVNIIGFSCANKQRTPKSFTYTKKFNGGPATSRNQLIDVLEKLRTTVVPDGGTCPGLAIEQAVRQIESTKQADYPLHTVILLTDGVFYDGQFPVRAAEGLEAYKALRFAVGIAVANSDATYGLTQDEIKTQRQQLSAFVGRNANLFKDLSSEGWGALPKIARKIAEELPDYYFQGVPIPRYSWCGWRRIGSCKQDKWRDNTCAWPNAKLNEWGCQKKKVAENNNKKPKAKNKKLKAKKKKAKKKKKKTNKKSG